MEHDLTLEASPRKVLGRKVRHLRKQGQLPLILYGKGIGSKALSVPEKTFRKVYRQAGQSSLVDVKIGEGKPVKALIHEVQTDPVTDQPLHVDLYQVNMTEKVRTEVPLRFVGEATAVKELEGNLITQKDHLTVEALPADLPREIEIDISPLKTFEDAIKVSDIKLPAGVDIIGSEEDLIAQVTPPRSEEELAALEAPVTEEEGIAKLEETMAAEKVEAEAAKVEGEEVTPSQPSEATTASPQQENKK